MNYFSTLVEQNFIEELGIAWIVLEKMEKNLPDLGERCLLTHLFIHSWHSLNVNYMPPMLFGFRNI
jgi:hypothetical protein